MAGVPAAQPQTVAAAGNTATNAAATTWSTSYPAWRPHPSPRSPDLRRPKGKPYLGMVVAISAHDVPALLGLNPYVAQKLAMAKVLLQQRVPILEAMRGDSLVKRALGDIYAYSYDVDAAIRGRGGRANVLQCDGFVIYGYPSGRRHLRRAD